MKHLARWWYRIFPGRAVPTPELETAWQELMHRLRVSK